MINYIIFGSNGTLGKSIKDSKLFERSLYLSREDVDVGKFSQVQKIIKEYRPKYVINCSAFTKVDQCQTNKQTYIVNSIAPLYMFQLSKIYSFKLIHISTSFVFGEGVHKQKDTFNPMNQYGRSKSLGQNFIDAKNSLIIRTSWLYGAQGTNFLSKSYQLVKSNQFINCPKSYISRLTYVKDLVYAIYNLQNLNGIYHFANKGNVSIYGFLLVLRALSESTCQINEVQDFIEMAPRPNTCILDTQKYQKLFLIRDWTTTLKEYINDKESQLRRT